MVALLLLTASASYGQTGNLLGQVTFSTDCGFLSGVGSGVGVGITFDGTNLWYSCYNSKNSSDPNHFDLHKADPKTGGVIATYLPRLEDSGIPVARRDLPAEIGQDGDALRVGAVRPDHHAIAIGVIKLKS